MRITKDSLVKIHACEDQVKLFAQVFPHDATLSVSTLKKARAAGLDVEWWAARVMTPAQWEEYQKARGPAWDEFDKVRAPAWEEFDKVRAAAWDEFDKVCDAAYERYKKVCGAAWDEYEKARDAAIVRILEGRCA